MPDHNPDTISFPVPGVHLVQKSINCSQDHCSLRLRGLTRDHSGGAYRCEISSEAPTFRLVSKTRNVTIAGKSHNTIQPKKNLLTLGKNQ